MADGSRQFAKVAWRPAEALKAQLTRCEGVTIKAFVDAVVETWIDFNYGGHEFSTHSSFNDFWLFVRDPCCPEKLLHEVHRMLA